MFSYIDLEKRISSKHPLRKIRKFVREVFEALSADFDKLYSTEGRPSIPPDMLIDKLMVDTPLPVSFEPATDLLVAPL